MKAHHSAGLFVALLILGACGDEQDPPSTGADPSAAAPELAPDPTSAASRRLVLSVGHCWIEPVRFDGADWAVVAADQTGWGGGMPDGWQGHGTLTRLSVGRSQYEDDGGPVLNLVLADQPDAAQVFKQGCD